MGELFEPPFWVCVCMGSGEVEGRGRGQNGSYTLTFVWQQLEACDDDMRVEHSDVTVSARK